MKISIIAAIGKNHELGKNNKLVWNIQEDLQRFRKITKGHAIIMGRKTFESLPIKPLPKRYNIVVTRDQEFKINNLRKGENFTIVSALGKALAVAKKVEKNEIFVIGGGQIFEQAIALADKLYLTLIENNFDADTFFPDYSDFKKVISEKEGKSEGYKYKFLELEK